MNMEIAVLRDSVLERGDLSPLFLFWRLVAKAVPRSAARGMGRRRVYDGDKSPRKSADKSAHSKVASPTAVQNLRAIERFVKIVQ
jgi:hypothetical protein